MEVNVMIEKIHVVHVHDKFYPFMGGSTHRLLNLLKNIDYNYFDVTVICENSENVEKKGKFQNINIIRYDSYIEIPKILKLLNRDKKIDIIHGHNFRPSLFSYITNRVLLKRPFIMEMHSIYETSNFIKQYIGTILLKKSDRVIVLSNKSKQYLINNDQIEESKISVIYNGIDFNEHKNYIKLEDDKINKIIKDEKLIKLVYVGSLDRFQGINNVIEVINNVNREDIAFLIIGGNNNQIHEVKNRINNVNVNLIPYIDSKYVPFIYFNADLLLVLRPSMLSTETAVPLKPLEALINKTKVLSTKVGGMIELQKVLGSDNIHFFDNNKEVIDYINNLEKKQLKFQGEETLQMFNVEKQSRALDNFYKELMETFK
jgi:glycosyltransferase involved in cell wall biosynthesis